MKTATQIKKEARERFEKEFSFPKQFEDATAGFGYIPERNWVITDDIKKRFQSFLDELIDDTIKQTLEGVRVKETEWSNFYLEQKFNIKTPRQGYNFAVKQQNKLAKEIKG
jgi:hypothetical protein